MSTLNQNSRRDFLKRFSLMCVAAIAAPMVLQAAGTTASTPASATTPASEPTTFTRFSVMPGNISGKEVIEKTLKSIEGIKEAEYNTSYRYANISYHSNKNSLSAIVQAARDKGVNVQRLRCDKRAPYCDRQCQQCPAKRNEF